MNIVLIGMPGCGKSTIGVVLAKTMGYGFLDTDLLIQHRQNKLLQNIIDDEGAEAFKKAEEDALLSVNCENTVIATGGSAVYSHKGMEHLKSRGKIVYIKLSCKNIEKRLSNLKTRGVVGAESSSIEDIYNERTPLYEKYSDITVDCDNIKDLTKCMEKIKAEIMHLA